MDGFSESLMTAVSSLPQAPMFLKMSQSPTESSGRRQCSTTWSKTSKEGPHRLLENTGLSAESDICKHKKNPELKRPADTKKPVHVGSFWILLYVRAFVSGFFTLCTEGDGMMFPNSLPTKDPNTPSLK